MEVEAQTRTGLTRTVTVLELGQMAGQVSQMDRGVAWYEGRKGDDLAQIWAFRCIIRGFPAF